MNVIHRTIRRNTLPSKERELLRCWGPFKDCYMMRWRMSQNRSEYISSAREGGSGKCDRHTNTISISNFEISCHRVGAVCLAALINNFKWSLQKVLTKQSVKAELQKNRQSSVFRGELEWCVIDMTVNIHTYISWNANRSPKTKPVI